MSLLAASPAGPAGPQLAAGCGLAALAFLLLLPRPRGRSVAVGVFLGLAAAVVLTLWVVGRFGEPARDAVGNVLFWLFSAGAVGFAAVFVAQRNPARGAIAFAFVILSTCGLFLLLAAPFLMAATVIIYAGAIIVTFLFVLMLSQTRGPSDENDRSREPFLGSLAGFGFLGLVLLALYRGGPAAAGEYPLPARPVTADERAALLAAADRLANVGTADELKAVADVRFPLLDAVGGPNAVLARLDPLVDPRSKATRRMAEEVRTDTATAFDWLENRVVTRPNPAAADVAEAANRLAKLREKVLVLSGQGELPARNVANVGLAVYSDHLLGVEMAGAILLVATVGAVAVAGRKGVTA
jgi:NADH:ubiquinone oxidoreductase subunit 6 (subunit J)